ncbi:N-acetyltransferase family protein [Bacillus infantis]|uniref:GNAT family N-acetyltransferase n=1 Tax=Bacillus infantis TaxID=324767 RepID=UPI003CF86A5E
MFIRKANRAETEQLLYTTVHVMEESSMGHLQNDPQKGLGAFIPALQSGAFFYVAVHDYNILGWLMAGRDTNPVNGNNAAFLYSLYVFPPYRKLGVGRMLMSHAVEVFRREGYEKVQLNVFQGNPAKRMYEKFGFHDISTVMEIKF